MARTFRWAFLAVLLSLAPARAADDKYSIKTAPTPPPKELKEPIARLLSDQAVQLLDGQGNLAAEVWLRKEVPVKAGGAQVKNGLTYQDLEETTLLGAVRFAQQAGDYRKQQIKPGVYTLRLGLQPMDGDHMGTAPYPEFCLLVPAALDEKPEPMKEPKGLYDLSAKAAKTSHPGVFLLYPNPNPKETPELAHKEGAWVLNWKEVVTGSGQKGVLGIGLVLVGHSSSL